MMLPIWTVTMIPNGMMAEVGSPTEVIVQPLPLSIVRLYTATVLDPPGSCAVFMSMLTAD